VHQYRVGARLIREGRTDGKQPVDGANAVQVAERADRPVAERLDRYEAVIEPVLRWRRRLRHLRHPHPRHLDASSGYRPHNRQGV
jgi:hypothetical protein